MIACEVFTAIVFVTVTESAIVAPPVHASTVQVPGVVEAVSV